MKYSQIPLETADMIQFDSTILLTDFDPATGEFERENIIGATSGGSSFASNPNHVDLGEDMDNINGRMMELQRFTHVDPVVSGTFVTIDTAMGKKLLALADIDGNKLTPRINITDEDFMDIWLVGNYSRKNGATGGGSMAIHIKNAMNTGGFNWQSTKNGKGTFSYEFRGHYSLQNVDEIPFEAYITAGTDETAA